MDGPNEGVREPGQPRPGRSDKERAIELRHRIWTLRLEGYSKRHIAVMVGVDVRTVRRHIQKTEERLMAEDAAMARRVRARQAEQLEHKHSEMVAAWEASKAKPTVVRIKTDPDGKKETIETVHLLGDIEYAREARAVLADERALWGIGRDANEGPADTPSVRDALTEAEARADVYQGQEPGGTPP